jgi:hypothetical protein
VEERRGAVRTAAPPVPLDEEGIDYSDIPDTGDDENYWRGGQVGSVLVAKAAGEPS